MYYVIHTVKNVSVEAIRLVVIAVAWHLYGELQRRCQPHQCNISFVEDLVGGKRTIFDRIQEMNRRCIASN